MSDGGHPDRVLIVEADAKDRATMLALFDSISIEAVGACDPEDALKRLDDESFDLVVTDLPRECNLAVKSDDHVADCNALHTANALLWVKQIRNVAPRTPIVLTTHEDTEPAACEALLQGAASYVPKRLAEENLVETVQQVIKVSQASQKATEVDECVSRVKLSLTLPSHEGLVPSVIAKLESATAPLGLFDEMVWTQVAMALDEAILNAMIHGNLEVESELREQGDGQAYWDKIAARREAEPYGQRSTEVTLTATRTQAVFVVRDQGPGFDVNSLPDPTDPANLESIGGRGLLLIGAFMDEVHHNEIGNELTMIKRKAAGIRDDEED